MSGPEVPIGPKKSANVLVRSREKNMRSPRSQVSEIKIKFKKKKKIDSHTRRSQGPEGPKNCSSFLVRSR